MNNKYIILSAQIISTLFTPFYLPTVALIAVLPFTYLRTLPFLFHVQLVFVVFIFTVLLPRTIIYAYRQHNGWSSKEMSLRHRRYTPYIISIVCYTLLLIMLACFNMADFVSSIISSALMIQIICAVVNKWVKVSTHAAASGGVIGMLFAFSYISNFNAINWIAFCVLLCGCVCTARMILRQHTYHELFLGVVIGIVSGLLMVFLV